MNNRMFTGLFALLFLVMLSVTVAYANSDNRGGGGRPPQGPPPEAIAACEGKSVGDTVSFKGRRGESLEATCAMVKEQLVAVPEGHRPPPQREQQ